MRILYSLCILVGCACFAYSTIWGAYYAVWKAPLPCFTELKQTYQFMRGEV